MLSAQQIIQQYNLQPHPEGGWYKETYRSNEFVIADALPERFGGDRAFRQPFIFYWNREISLPFTGLKVMSAGIFMPVILY